MSTFLLLLSLSVNLYLLVNFFKLKKEVKNIFSYHFLLSESVKKAEEQFKEVNGALNAAVKKIIGSQSKFEELTANRILDIKSSQSKFQEAVVKNALKNEKFAEEVRKFVSITVKVLGEKDKSNTTLLLDSKKWN